MPDSPKNLCCSFCGNKQNEVKKLIAGPSVYICDECIHLCSEIMVAESEKLSEHKVKKSSIPEPKEIMEFLDQYIIGQYDAKLTLSVAVNNHYKRLANPIIDGVEIDKSNILLLGPTGSGKTLIAKSIARLLDVPFTIADATSLTEAGYVGDDVETIISRLLLAANGDVHAAQRGIIYLDEVDKKAKRAEGASVSRDVSGEGVQQALLKIIEGAEVRVSMQGNRKHPQSDMIVVDTSNILFIVGGAFVGLDHIVDKRINKGSSTLGFGSTPVDKDAHDINGLLAQVEPQDLVKFGLIPEFVGRLPIITHLTELNEEQLIKVLTEPKNAIIRQFQKLFGLENISLEFSPEALTYIAQHAIERHTGARGLRGVIEKRLVGIQFRLPDLYRSGVEKIFITPDFFAEGRDPIFVYKDETA